METFEFAGRAVQWDAEATRAHRSVYNEPCACEGCALFRQAFPGQYPAAAAALERLGLDVFRPLECECHGADGDEVSFLVTYCVQGTLPADPLEGEWEGLPARLYRKEPGPNTDLSDPFFYLEIGTFPLPRPDGWEGEGEEAEPKSFLARLGDWLLSLLHGG